MQTCTSSSSSSCASLASFCQKPDLIQTEICRKKLMLIAFYWCSLGCGLLLYGHFCSLYFPCFCHAWFLLSWGRPSVWKKYSNGESYLLGCKETSHFIKDSSMFLNNPILHPIYTNSGWHYRSRVASCWRPLFFCVRDGCVGDERAITNFTQSKLFG